MLHSQRSILLSSKIQEYFKASSFSAFNFLKFFLCRLSCRPLLIFWSVSLWFQKGFQADSEMFIQLQKYSWLTALSFALDVLFFRLTSLTVSHAIRDYLSPTEFLILSIWPWMYTNYSFWYVLVSSFWNFQSFCAFAFVGFLYLSKDDFLKLYCYSLSASDSHGTQYLALSLVTMDSVAVAASTWAVTKISHLSFRVSISNIFRIVMNLFLTVTVYLFISLLVIEDH